MYHILLRASAARSERSLSSVGASAAGNGTGDGAFGFEEDSGEAGAHAVLFIFFGLVLGTLLRRVESIIRIPYTVA